MIRKFFSASVTMAFSWLPIGIFGILMLPFLSSLFLSGLPGFAGEEKKTFSAMAKFIHGQVVTRIPKEFEEKSEWGKTIPATEPLRLPRLPRIRMKNGDKEELPHGLWKRTKIWMDNPHQNVLINVSQFKLDKNNVAHITVEATADFHAEREWQPWQKGLPLPVLKVQADVKVALHLEVEAKVGLTLKLPPETTLEPKIIKAHLELKDFEVVRLSNRILAIENDSIKEMSRELKGLLQELVKQYEPQILAAMNQGIGVTLKDGKTTLPAAEAMKLMQPDKK
jgi:hypothetical protein